jgi:hypothetical protein
VSINNILLQLKKNKPSIINMSLYGYDQSISQGQMMNARNVEFNQGVKLHNKLVMDKYDLALKTQKTTESNLKDKKRNDAVIHDTTDGYGLIGAGVQVLGARKEYQKAATFGDYVKNVTEQRTKTIRGGLEDIKMGKEGRARGGKATGDSGGNLDNEDGIGAQPMSDGDRERATKKATLGEGEEADSVWNETSQADRDVLVKSKFPAYGATRSAITTAPTESGLPASRVGMSSAPMSAVGEGEVASESFEHQGTGIGAKIIKSGLTKIGVTEALGEGATGALAEGAGKIAGAIQGGTDLVEGFDNLAEGKGFFAQDGNDTAKKVGDSFVMAGSVLDAIGTFVPPLEVVGALASVTGGIVDTVDDWFGDKHKLKAAGKPITTPSLKNSQLEGQKISPAFQSLGLVASAPTSVKSRIQGSSSF